MYQNLFIFVLIVCSLLIVYVQSHGMMLEPPGRASRWRFDDSAPTNFDDDGLYCGGLSVQWGENEGKCGLCGDDYGDTKPRAHEFSGHYGEGVIVRSYKSGSTIDVGVYLSANHMGDFKWDICNMDIENESDECFSRHKVQLTNGQSKYVLESHISDWYNTTIQIPDGLKCKHCVLRWTYRAANNWNFCEDGTGRVGCGPQEHFRSCADISKNI